MSIAIPKEQWKPFTGIDLSLSNEDYHAHPAIGSSGIRAFLRTPATYHHHYVEQRGAADTTPAQEFGTFSHCYVLEPDVFAERYIIASEAAKDRRAAAWKRAEEEAEAEGKAAVLHKDFERLQAMRGALLAHKLVRGILTAKERKFEMTAFCVDEETGLHLKARPDIFLDDLIVDYKTTGIDLGVTAYSRHEYSMGRHIQGWHHKNVTEKAAETQIHKVLHIVQQAEAPYLVRVFNMGEDWLDLGRRMTDTALLEIAECQRTGKWPGYPETDIEDLILPNWAGTEIN